jgi:hypothetical protein
MKRFPMRPTDTSSLPVDRACCGPLDNETGNMQKIVPSLIFMVASMWFAAAPALAESRELRFAVEQLISGHESVFRSEIRKLCEAGEVEAQLTYGRFLVQKAENAEAERWLKSAAKSGSPDAQYHLGVLYLQTKPGRAEEARTWLSTAAGNGHKRAAHLLAMFDKPMHTRDGKLNVKEVLDDSVVIGKLKAESLSDNAIACYRHTRTTYDAALDHAMSNCVVRTRTNFGEWVDPETAKSMGISFAKCVNEEMLRPKNMSYDDLIQCYRTGPKP